MLPERSFCPPAAPSASVPPSPTSVNLNHLAALFAFDIAAPVELAAAPVHHLHLLRLEAAAAAHQLTAVDGFRGSVTLAAHRAQHARRAWVEVAEVRTGVQVDQVFIGVRLELGVARHQDLGGAHLALLHLSGSVKLFLDDVSDFAEGRHGLPAGLHLAGAGHAVTFAFNTHMGQDGLQTWQQLKKTTRKQQQQQQDSFLVKHPVKAYLCLRAD